MNEIIAQYMEQYGDDYRISESNGSLSITWMYYDPESGSDGYAYLDTELAAALKPLLERYLASLGRR